MIAEKKTKSPKYIQVLSQCFKSGDSPESDDTNRFRSSAERSLSELETSRKVSNMFRLLMFLLAIVRVKVNVIHIARVERLQ